MQDAQLSQISNFIWNTADSVLRDLYVRGKYKDVLLPMTVIRRLDAVLEPTNDNVLAEKKLLDEAGIIDQVGPLQQAAGQQFYNASPFTLKDLRNDTSQQQLRDNFNAYLDGFSPNVQDILDKFEFRNQITRLSTGGTLGALIERFLTNTVNFSPKPVLNDDETVKLPGLDNHAMGTIFEDLVRRFNEENNEEAGEHWTPRDAVGLMANLVFLPIKDQIQPTTYVLYDGAIGTGGMLTVAEETLHNIAQKQGKDVSTHLYGQEINSETYAICKADLLLKSKANADANIVGGPEYSTLSNDVFKNQQFDFMLSNPPYGKSWNIDLDKMGGKSKVIDPRFVIQHADDPEYSMITRVNDGQLMFLANMLSKMKEDTPLGSRIAEVHNGSSLFTGDAGQGESNIRRWIIENDWLEAIVALPLNMFYNTGIATYVWVLTNRKPTHRRGYVQLIDATDWYRPLRRNLGQKTREVSAEDIQRICDAFLDFEESDQSRIFPNEAFGYWKVTVERPLRLAGTDPERVYKAAEIKKLKAEKEKDENAAPIIRKVLPTSTEPNLLQGRVETTLKGKTTVVEYDPDTDLRDTEQVPLLHPGGIESFLSDEVLPYAPDAWYNPEAVRIGYEINFSRHFYRPQPMRPLEEIRADLLAVEKEAEGILEGILAR